MKFYRFVCVATFLVGIAQLFPLAAFSQFNKPNTERGNALLRELDFLQGCAACRVYLGHVGVLGNWNGSNSENPANYDVFQQQSRTDIVSWVSYPFEATNNTLKKTSFETFTKHNNIVYNGGTYYSYGGGWTPTGFLWRAERFTASRRDQIVTTASSLEGINIEFFSFPFTKIPVANMFTGTGSFRCDGIVEYIYEQAGAGSGRGLYPSYLEACCIPAPASYVVNAAELETGTPPSMTVTTIGGGTVTDGSAISSTTVTIAATESAYGSGIYAISLNSDVRTQGGALSANETFSSLTDGSYTATVTDLAGNQASMKFSINTQSSDSSEEDTARNSINVLTSTQCVVPVVTNSGPGGICSISIAGPASFTSSTYTYHGSTEALLGEFCQLPAGTYTVTGTACSGAPTVSSFTYPSPESTYNMLISAVGPGGTRKTSSVALSSLGVVLDPDMQLSVIVRTNRAPPSTTETICLRTSANIGGASAPCSDTVNGTTSERVVLPMTVPFSVTNATDSSHDHGISIEASLFKSGFLQQASIDFPFDSGSPFAPGATISGTVYLPQAGQLYSTDSPDQTAHSRQAIKNISSVKCTVVETLLQQITAQILAWVLPDNNPYCWSGSEAVYTSPRPMSFTFQAVPGITVDTTTLRIYGYDISSGVWTTDMVVSQSVSMSSTGYIVASGSYSHTGTYGVFFVGIDTTFPSTTFAIQGSSFVFDGALFVSTDAFVVLTATDPAVNGFASTVSSITYRIDPSSESLFSVYSSSIPLPLGTHVFEYRSRDYAGNTETVKTATFTVTAGSAFRTANSAQAPGNLLNGFLGSGAKLEVVSRAEDNLTLMISSANRQAMVSVDNIGEVGIGVSPRANLNIGQDSIALQLRSGNSTSAVTSNQIALGYNGDYAMSHLMRTEHSTAAHGNKLDFLVWNPGAGSTTTAAALNVLSLQGITAASGGSFHVQPVGEPDAEVEVSNGLSTGGGTLQRLQVVSPSSRRFKSDIKDLSAKDEDRALDEVAGLKHASFRYKARRKDGSLIEDPAQPQHVGLIYEDAPESIRDGKEALSTTERLVNVEMALKASIRRLEELQKRYEKLKARRKNP